MKEYPLYRNIYHLENGNPQIKSSILYKGQYWTNSLEIEQQSYQRSASPSLATFHVHHPDEPG